MSAEHQSKIQYGIRLGPVENARLEFLAKLVNRAPTNVATVLLSEAIRARIHEMTRPSSDKSDDLETASRI